MVSDAIAVFRLLRPDKSKDKQLVQSQMEQLLEFRREPCMRLWGSLWRWLDEVGQLDSDHPADAASIEKKLGDLRLIIADATPMIGALVSVDTFLCLTDLHVSLNKKGTRADELSNRLATVRSAIYPTNINDESRSKWGLLLLLRDEIGSNSLAASAILK